MAGAFAIVALLVCLGAVSAQPFDVEPLPFSPEMAEPQERIQDKYKGFTFDFDEATVADVTPNGKIVPNQVNTNPFLSTLTNDGAGQTLVVLGPCASNNPHTHPRGAEISHMLYGCIQFGMVEENGAGNRLVLRNITKGTTIHVPQGLLHFSHNPNCEPAAFLANFATRDPGTQTMWQSLFTVPTNILNAASGLPEKLIEKIKDFPFVMAPGTGGEECLKRCGLSFKEENTFATGNNY